MNRMLGIIIPYHSFFEFLEFQIPNLQKHIQVPFRVYIVDNSLENTIKYHGKYLEQIKYFFCFAKGSPSHRHQETVNLGLSLAWEHCDAFLIFDNDMIFLNNWTPPPCVAYHPQRRGTLEYGWLNLFYFPKMECFHTIDFANCPVTRERTDSGGSIGLHLPSIKNKMVINYSEPIDPYFPEYCEKYRALAKQYNVGPWMDVFSFNGTDIFHFRALSNWTKYPEEFQLAKKKLILDTMLSLK